MVIVISSIFCTLCFPHEGKIVTIYHLSFLCSSSNEFVGLSILVIDNSYLTTKNIHVRMYSSFMGTFNFTASSHHVYVMSSRTVSTWRSIYFRTSYFSDHWTLPSSTASCEGQPHTGIISPTSISHVEYGSTTSASHAEYQQPSATSHVGGTSLVIVSHTAHTSQTSTSHVGDSSPTSTSHVGDFLLASTSHAGSMSPATTSHAGCIHMIEKPRHVRRKPKFICRLCKGYHLTCLHSTTTVVQEARSFPRGPFCYHSRKLS
jgi:hypothetical protein